MEQEQPASRVPSTQWDPLVRVFHWSVAGFFGLAYVVDNDWPQLHSQAGYTVALLIAFRLVWGVIGSEHARFGHFIAGPRVTLTYVYRLLHGRPPRIRGHDPAGALMIVVLLVCLSITALSGMALFAMAGSGPLADTFVSGWPDRLMVDVHHFFSEATLWLVVIHVCGVLLMSALHRQNLIGPMLTSRKKP